MSDAYNPLNERFEELLVAKVTEGLDSSAQSEFEQTDWSAIDHDPHKELEQFERAAAAFALAFDQAPEEPLPTDLQKKILASATTVLAGNPPDNLDKSTKREFRPPTELRQEIVESVLAPPSWREGLALLTTAACVAFLIFNWQAFMGRSALSADQKMALFVESNPPDMVDVAWVQVTDKDAEGKVLWSDAQQEGYMVFDGLDVNDPKVKQYQLWIFEDPKQPHPIDGGVFDVTSTDKVVIPIDAKIPVDKAVQFAITVEDPGGVVVSERENVPVLADVDSAN